MPRYTDTEIEAFVSLLGDVKTTLDTALLRADIITADQMSYNDTLGVEQFPLDGSIPYEAFLFATGVQGVFVNKSDYLTEQLEQGIVIVDNMIASFKNPSVPSNAPLATIPTTTPNTTLAAILKRIDAAHKSENDALYEIRVRVTENNSYLEAINKRVQQLQKSNAQLGSAINDARVELKEVRLDAQFIRQTQIPELDLINAAHYNSLLIKIDSIIAKLNQTP